jgi:ADP-ribosyl-[dinitrogen reductase] hydrolase
VLRAANLGEDADTTAAIAGQLAGALHGASSIPADWRAWLAWADRITASADTLVSAALSQG